MQHLTRKRDKKLEGTGIFASSWRDEGLQPKIRNTFILKPTGVMAIGFSIGPERIHKTHAVLLLGSAWCGLCGRHFQDY